MESEKNRGGLPVEWVEVKEVEEVEQAGVQQAGVDPEEVRQALCEGGGELV